MPKPIKIDKEIIIQLYHKENLSLEEAADKLGVSRDTIRRRMRLYGIPPKPPELYRKGQDKRIIVMLPLAKKLYYDDKLPVWEVCNQLGIAFYTLQRLFNDNGLSFRSTSESIKLTYNRYHNMGFPKGIKHPRYNNGRTEDRLGYVRIASPTHPRAKKNGYVFEHILVWEQSHNIPLPNGWVVHHLNGIKNDNRPENLLGMSSRAHHFVLAEKAKRIQLLESRIKELEQSLLEATKMHLP